MEDHEIQTGPDREQLEDNLNVFEAISDPDWDGTHLTFQAKDGDCIYRVARDAVHHIGHQEKRERPPQPPKGWGIAFEEHLWFFRSRDGWWYKVGRRGTSKNRIAWPDLWDAHAEERYKILVPMHSTQVPIMADKIGPVDEMALPDMSSGEPMPGLYAVVTNEGSIRIRDVRLDTELEMSEMDCLSVMGLYFRTMLKRNSGDDDDSGDSGPG